MLRKRSRAVRSKQGLMSDNSSLPSPTGKYNRPTTPSLFPSPRLFVGFSGKGVSDSEAAMSPTSILETKPFSALGNPFFTARNNRKPLPETSNSSESRHHPWENGDSKAIGLGIVDALNDDKPDKQSSKPESRMVLLGSQLKIQIPPIIPISISPTGSLESPHSPIEFGIKTKNFQTGPPSSARRSPMSSTNSSGSDHLASSPRVFTGYLSASEMELSEDYTCVISHVGPNPRTTHIFDNYIVESYSNGSATASRKENRFLADRPVYPSDKFLSYCYACKKNLGEGKDIYMYRGEKAFCSHECRYQEMSFDEGIEKSSSDLGL